MPSNKMYYNKNMVFRGVSITLSFYPADGVKHPFFLLELRINDIGFYHKKVILYLI